MAVTAIIKVPKDGAGGDSGNEDSVHLAGYTLEHFYVGDSTLSAPDTSIADVTWTVDGVALATHARFICLRFETAGDHVVQAAVVGNGGGTGTTSKTITSTTPAPVWEKFVKAGGDDTASGNDDANAWATIEHANERWGSNDFPNGQLGIVNIKDGAAINYTGDVVGQHDVSPRHGLLLYRPYGSGGKPQINATNTKNIFTNEATGVAIEWGWSVYMRDLKWTWDGRDEGNGIFFNNPGSQLDGCELDGGGTNIQHNWKHTFANGRVTNSGTNGVFASCPWAVLQNSTVDANCLAGVNAEHQVYGSNGLDKFLYDSVIVIGSTEGNDGLRAVSAKKGTITNCAVSSISNAGDAIFPGANNAGDDLGSDHVVERCVISSANRGVNSDGADGVLIRNVIIKSTTGAAAVNFGGHNTGPSAANSRLYNSVVYASDNADVTTDQYSTTSQVKNCIFQKTGGTDPFYDINTLANFTSDYNCFWRVGGTPEADANFAVVAGVTKTWAQWKALGQDAHSIFRDPLFTNAAGGDFTLQSTSPCIGIGATLGDVVRDYSNTLRTAPYTIGAYQASAGGGQGGGGAAGGGSGMPVLALGSSDLGRLRKSHNPYVRGKNRIRQSGPQ